jgi:hypothetical protein
MRADSIRNREAIERAIKMKRRIEPFWLCQDGVTGIGVGVKQTGGRLTQTLAILIYVKCKLPHAEVASSGRILVPTKIEGIPTDVIAMQLEYSGVLGAHAREEKFDELVGGISIANEPRARTTSGTLGMIVFDGTTSAPMILSNRHVLLGSDGAIGDAVIQPGVPVEALGGKIVNAAADCPGGLRVESHEPNGPLAGVFAGGVGGSIATALADEKDPFRRGQEATVPQAGELTASESVRVRSTFDSLPLPGDAYGVNVWWRYTRRTSGQAYDHVVEERRVNEHIIRQQRLWLDKTQYGPNDPVEMYAEFEPECGRSCDAYFVRVVFAPMSGQPSPRFVILSPIGSSPARGMPWSHEGGVNRCRYWGRLRRLPTTDCPQRWNAYLCVQTINTAGADEPPEIAAQNIGGLPVSHNYDHTDPDCTATPAVDASAMTT